jgi:hypothetical protein
VLSCRDEEAKRYVAEAVMCYRAGAYRACIVSTWIAVVFDLIAKFRELALSGDAEAQKITNELAAWQPLIEKGDSAIIRRSLELEREIVNIANDKFGFFDGIQVLDLTRLRDDRNRCAHPTFQGGGSHTCQHRNWLAHIWCTRSSTCCRSRPCRARLRRHIF